MKYNDNTQLAKYIILKLREEGYDPYLDRFSIDNSKLLYKYLKDKMPEYTAMMDPSYQYTKINDNLYRYELKPNTKYSLITQLSYGMGIPDTLEDAKAFEDSTKNMEKLETLDSVLKVMNWIEFENEWKMFDEEDKLLENTIKTRLVLNIRPSTESDIQKLTGIKNIKYIESVGWEFTDFQNNKTTINNNIIKASIFEPEHNIICYLFLSNGKIKVTDFSGIYIKSYNYKNLIKEIIVEEAVSFRFYQNAEIDYYLRPEEQKDFREYTTTIKDGIKIKTFNEGITNDTFDTINNMVELFKLEGENYIRAESYEPDTTYYVNDGTGNYYAYEKEKTLNLYTNKYFNSTVTIDDTEYFLLPYYNIVNGFSPTVSNEHLSGVGIRILEQQTYGCYLNYQSDNTTIIPVINPIISNFTNNGTLAAFNKYLNIFAKDGELVKLFDKDENMLILTTDSSSNKMFVYKYNYVQNRIVSSNPSFNYAKKGHLPELNRYVDDNKNVTTKVKIDNNVFEIKDDECIIINSSINVGLETEDNIIVYEGNTFNYKIIIYKNFAVGVTGDMQLMKLENQSVQTFELELTATTDIANFTTGDTGYFYLSSINDNTSLSKLPVIIREQSEYSELLATNEVTTEHLDMILLDRIITKYSEKEDIEYLQNLLGIPIDGEWSEEISTRIKNIKIKNKINSLDTIDFVKGDIYYIDESVSSKNKFVTYSKVLDSKNDLFTKETELTIELLNY